MIRLIVTDIDGTLVNDQKELPSQIYPVIEQLLEKGIVFCAASGRQHASLDLLFNPYRNQIGLLSENGALVTFKGEELYADPMSDSDTQLLYEISQQIPEIDLVICGRKTAYLLTQESGVFDYVRMHYPALEEVASLSDIEDDIFKFTIHDKAGSREHSFPYFSEIPKNIKVAISGDYWLDFTNASANKGVAIEYLQQKLGISKAETLVFGDYLNDLEMMRQAHYSYAMKNAQQEVKDIAQFVTTHDNNHNGVIETLRELGLVDINF